MGINTCGCRLTHYPLDRVVCHLQVFDAILEFVHYSFDITRHPENITMNVILLTLSLLSVLAMTAFATSNWNEEMRKYILDIHNEKRKGEGGCLMNKLVYDMELERQAKQWAEGCVFKHEMKEGRGENLGWNSNEKPEKELILGSSNNWFNEKRMYSYGQYSCGSSCHYTQMVWGSTSKVGCYSYRCPNLVNAYRNAWYLVCFYTPKGNWNGEKPYDKTCKAKCAAGQTVDNGLCVGDAKGGNGPNVGGDDGGCDDDQGRCADWAKNGQCKSNPDYMLKYCRKSCKVCVSNASCEDSNPGCEGWAKTGECRRNPVYMEKSCRKSCHMC